MLNNVKKIVKNSFDVFLVSITPVLLTYIFSKSFHDKNLLTEMLAFSKLDQKMLYYLLFGIVTTIWIFIKKYRHQDLELFMPKEMESKYNFFLTLAKSLIVVFLAIEFGTLLYYEFFEKLFYFMPLRCVINEKLFFDSNLKIKLFTVLFATTFYGILPGLGFAFIKSRFDELSNTKIKKKNIFFNLGTFVCVLLFITINLLFDKNLSSIYIITLKFITQSVFMYAVMLICDHSENTWPCIFLFTLCWHAC